MRKKQLSLMLALCMALSSTPVLANETASSPDSAISTFSATNISTADELENAFKNGGEYTLTSDITITKALSLSSGKTLVINGNNHVIQPKVTGLNDQGLVNENANEINIITNSGNLEINNLKIYGGKSRAVENRGTLKAENVSIEKAHSTADTGAGAGLYNYGKVYMKNCLIRRNASDTYGGGFYNSGGTMILENTSIIENRNINSGGQGGGAGENGGSIYMNNCTVANNQSSEIGGGINNFRGTLYILNSVFTGNVTTGKYVKNYYGGAIGNNGGKVYAANSAFTYNYAGGVLSDIGLYSGTDVYLYNCAYTAIKKSASAETEPTIKDSKDLSSENTIDSVFNGSRESGIVDGDGVEQDTKFDRPLIMVSDDTYGVYPNGNSPLLTGGTKTYFDFDLSNWTVKMAYGDNATALGNLAAATTQVTKYSTGENRDPNVIGASSSKLYEAKNYTVKVNAAEGGTVGGGSVQGDSYKENTRVKVKAVPDKDHYFKGWIYGNDEEISITTPTYEFVLTSDVTLTPVFAEKSATSPASFTLVIKDNFGETLESDSFEEGDEIKLVAPAKKGYKFVKWTSDSDDVEFDDETAEETYFTMPYGNVTITAVYEKDSDTTPAAYTLTIKDNFGDILENDKSYEEGSDVEIEAGTKEGYHFVKWTSDDVEFDDATAEKTYFTMPGKDVTVTLVWAKDKTDNKEDESDKNYSGSSSSSGSSGGGGGSVNKKDITADGAIENGTVKSDKDSATNGTKVTITVTPDEGYEIDKVTVTDKNGKEIELTDLGNGKYSFAMPSTEVKVNAEFKESAKEEKTVIKMQIGSKTIYVNDKEIENDVAPVIINDRTLVPVRVITETLGGDVEWNEDAKTVTLNIDGETITMTIGVELEDYGVAPTIIDDRTYVPIRFVAEKLGAVVTWVDETKEVVIEK